MRALLRLRLGAAAVVTACVLWPTASAFGTDFPAKRFGDLYSSTAPSAVLVALQTDIAPGQGLVLSGAQVTPGTFAGTGDCAAGSAYRTWIDTPESLQRTRCDGSVTTTPHAALPTRYQGELRKLGALMITSIPGQSIDLKQNGVTLTASREVVTEQLECPVPRRRTRYPAIQVVELGAASSAALTFCASRDRLSIARFDRYSPRYASAFTEVFSDPLRKDEFGGDRQKTNLYLTCALRPFDFLPLARVRYRRGALRASFLGMPTVSYCDRVGQYTQRIQAQIRRPGRKHYKPLGAAVLHVMGLREIVVWLSTQRFKPSDVRVRRRLPGTAISCPRGSRRNDVRIMVSERFRWMYSQRFVHASDGTTGHPDQRRATVFRSGTIHPCRTR